MGLLTLQLTRLKVRLSLVVGQPQILLFAHFVFEFDTHVVHNIVVDFFSIIIFLYLLQETKLQLTRAALFYFHSLKHSRLDYQALLFQDLSLNAHMAYCQVI